MKNLNSNTNNLFVLSKKHLIINLSANAKRQKQRPIFCEEAAYSRFILFFSLLIR